MKIDFGSGYNPRKGYATCDRVTLPNLDFWYDPDMDKIIGKDLLPITDNSVDLVRAKNVIHHIENLNPVFEELFRVLKEGGKLIIIEPNEKAYPVNEFLDRLWYRSIIPQEKLWFAITYRYYRNLLTRWADSVKVYYKDEKEYVIATKRTNPRWS
jgi:ubiquinone/menaquinone biosynthesis C-methylase UbiE